MGAQQNKYEIAASFYGVMWQVRYEASFTGISNDKIEKPL